VGDRVAVRVCDGVEVGSAGGVIGNSEEEQAVMNASSEEKIAVSLVA
jgi:hypothetical protein